MHNCYMPTEKMTSTSKKFGVLAICITIYCVLFIFLKKLHFRADPTEIHFENNDGKKACIQPVLSPFQNSYAKYFFKLPQVKCKDEPDWIEIKKGTFFITKEAIKRNGNISCTITYILRNGNDIKLKFSPAMVIEQNKSYILKDDFFKAECESKNQNYSNYHAGIAYHPDIHSRTSNTSGGLGFNIMMLGFDSVSHMSYLRNLPKSYGFFTKKLNGITLNGYNVAGDGTEKNLIPILTGKTEAELPNARKNRRKSFYVNVWPFIWESLQKKGYVTSYVDDSTTYGAFTFRLKGFKTQPTDHYMRTFYLAAKAEFKNHQRLCLGSKRRIQVMLNYILNFYRMYKNKKKFSFAFHAELSHDDLNLLGTADNDLLQFLKDFRDEGHLDNTLLILMSDHGFRFGVAREGSEQAKLEERLPFFGIAIPKNMAEKYPRILKNLKLNADRLTTPFDINPTLREAIQFSGGGSGTLKLRGISLFQEIPLLRTCKHAGIDEHYCTCIRWKRLDPADKKIQMLAETVLSHIDNLTGKFRNMCSKYELSKVIRANSYDPKPNSTTVKMGYNDTVISLTEVFQIRIQVSPLAHFETTARWNSTINRFHIASSISRTDIYGNTTRCISDKDPGLAKFCHCKKLDKSG